MNTQSTPKEEKSKSNTITIIAFIIGFSLLVGVGIGQPILMKSHIRTELGPVAATAVAALVDSSVLRAESNKTYDPKNPWNSIRKFIIVDGRYPTKVEDIGKSLPKPWEIKLGTPTEKTIVTLPNNKKFDAYGPVTDDPITSNSQ